MSDDCPKYLVLLIILKLTGCLVFVMHTSVAIVTCPILEGSVVRVEVGWPAWVIIPTRFEEGGKESPVSVEVAGLGCWVIDGSTRLASIHSSLASLDLDPLFTWLLHPAFSLQKSHGDMRLSRALGPLTFRLDVSFHAKQSWLT